MPRSFASRRASGEALMRPPSRRPFVSREGSSISAGCSELSVLASRPRSRSSSRFGATAGFSALSSAPSSV